MFWKTSKQLLHINKKSQSVPPLVFNGKYADDDQEKDTILNNYFASQFSVDDQNKMLPNLPPVQHNILASINISCQYVSDVLKNLNVTKACGPDLLNPRLLKKGEPILSSPLSFF